MGFETRIFDVSNPGTFVDAITPGTRIVLTEVVSNPMLRVTHFGKLEEAAKAAGALLLVDNTFTTPSGFNPLAHGADLVMHSVTKMLSGHADEMRGLRLGSIRVDLETFSTTRMRLKELIFGV